MGNGEAGWKREQTEMLTRGKPGVNTGKVQTWSRQIDSRISNAGNRKRYRPYGNDPEYEC